MSKLPFGELSTPSSIRARLGARRARRRRGLIFRPWLVHLEQRIVLSVDYWTGALARSSGIDNWSNAGNWSLGAVPGASDTADFTSSQSQAGTAVVDTAMTIGALVIDSTWGGTLTVSNSLAVSGDFTLASGTVTGNGTISSSGNGSQWTGGSINFGTGSLANAGMFTIATTTFPNNSFYFAGTLTNTGSVVVTGTNTIYANDAGTTIDNQASGTFDFQSGASINSNNESSTAFNNAGTLERSTGSGTANISFPVDDSGTIAGNSGTLFLSGGGSSGGSSDPGIVDAGTGAVVILGGTYSGSFAGSGAGSVVLSDFIGAAATLNFTGNVLEWANVQEGSSLGGTVTNAGSLTIATTTIPNNSLYLSGTLTNTGSIVVTGTNTIYANASGTTIGNQLGGTFDFQSGAGINSNSQTSTAFNNAGTLERTTGTGTATIALPVSDTGTIQGNAGTLLLTSGSGGTSENPGLVNSNSGGTVILSGTYSGWFAGSGTGAVDLSDFTGASATLDFSASVLQWTNTQYGNILSGTVTNSGALTIATTTIPNNGVSISGTLTNTGAIVVTGIDAIAANASGTTIDNEAAGTFDFQSAATLDSNAQTSTAFNNAGTLERTTGTGTASIAFPVNDTGTIQGNAGTLVLTVGGSGGTSGNTGIVNAGVNGTVILSGTYSGSFAGSGTGAVDLSNFTGTNATLDFSGTVLQWTHTQLGYALGGTVTNTGALTIATTTIPNNGVTLYGTLTNSGSIVVTGTETVYAETNVATIDNQAGGTFDLQSSVLIGNESGTGTFNNAGILEISGTNLTATIAWPVYDTGSIQGSEGVLALTAGGSGGTSGSPGFVNAALGSTVVLAGTYSGSFTGSGTGAVDLSNFTGMNATLDFNGSVLQWTHTNFGYALGGTVTNQGALTIASTTTPNNGVTLYGTLINVSGGSIIVTGTNPIYFSANSATLENQAGATFSFQSSDTVSDAGGVSGNFNNAGIVEMSAAGDTATISIPVNGGTIDNDSGTLDLSGGGSNTTINVASGTTAVLNGGAFTGGTVFDVASGGLIDLTGGAFVTYGGTLSGSGTGTVELDGGTFYPGLGGVTLNFPGNLFQWSGGSMELSVGNVTNLGTMNLTASNSVQIYADGTLDNFGTIVQSGTGDFDLHSDNISPTSLIIERGASYLIESNAGITNAGLGDNVVDNLGTIEKTAGTGTSTLYIPTQGFLANTGTIEADSGTLQIVAAINQISGATLNGGTWNAMAGATLQFPSGTAITNNAATVNLEGAGAAIAGITGLAFNSGKFTATGGAVFTTASGFTNSGSLDVGTGSVINLTGNFAQTSTGAITDLIGGTPSSSLLGQIKVTGTAALAGAFDVALANAFGPSSGQLFDVMSFASATGGFTSFGGLAPFFTESQTATSLDIQDTDTQAIDLALTSVTAPTAASVGQDITVRWHVTDLSPQGVTASWQDSVYISETPAITSSSVLLGSVPESMGLSGGSSYDASLTAALPALSPGDYYILVQVDSLDELADSNRTNNTLAAATGQIDLGLPALTLGAPYSDSFTAPDQDHYYQVNVPAGGSLTVSLKSSASAGAVALYVGQGTLPTSYNYQEAAAISGEPNQTVTVPQVLSAETYYILAQSVSGVAATASFTLTATQTAVVGVSAISSYAGGTGGNVTVEIDGTNFTPSASASLSLGGTTINASAIDFLSASQIFATFDLAGAAVGKYSLSVHQGGQTATAASPLQVVAASAASLNVDLSVPQVVRSGRTANVVVTYTNETDDDMVAPVLEIASTNPDILFSLPDNPGEYVQTAQLLAVSPSGPAGILRPGQSGQLTMTLLSDDTTNGDAVPVQVNQLEAGQTIDWAEEKSSLEPPDITSAAWNVIYGNLVAALGTTTSSYDAAVAQVATYLSGLGETAEQTSDIGTLWTVLLAQAEAALPPQAAIATVDATAPTADGSALSLDRAFMPSIAARYTPGIFGLGWATSWQASLSVDGSGNVTIDAGGSIGDFAFQPNGTYSNVSGEYGTLTHNGGIYTFTDTDGDQSVYLPNGQLNYDQDPSGNRTTLGYDAHNHLVSLSFSNAAEPSLPPEQILLSYNNQGFVSQATDSAGEIWNYAYDSQGHLLSVTGPGPTAAGLTTTYSYDTSSNPATANAILSVTYSDGSQEVFTYDTLGRLTRASGNDGADAVSYAYLGTAEVLSTDAAGDSTTLWYNQFQETARVLDALGGITTYVYDNNGNLVSSTDAAGDTYHYTYDQNGNMTNSSNPLGQIVQMTYDSLSELRSITDSDGNTTQYNYSVTGNLLDTIYPDGTQQSFAYDSLGNDTESTMQNGDPTSYQYSAQGQIIEESFADGTSETFTYDPLGDVLETQTYDSSGNLTGTTTLTYNAAEELTSIDYPGGLSLTYSYNAQGQCTQMIDESGYTISYSYDNLGRLIGISDGRGMVVSYSYNAVGEIAEQQNGNGTYTKYDYGPTGDVTSELNFAPGGAVDSSFTYTYNVLGEMTSMTDDGGDITTYAYDSLGQLTQTNLPGGQSIIYLYNAAGDRTEAIDSGVATNYTSNADNETIQVGSTTYTYDANGNLHTVTNASGTTTYSYNDQNELDSIDAADATVTAFQYSPLGYMTGMTVNGVRTSYLVDPTNAGSIVASYDGSGSLIAHYNYGLGLSSQTGPGGTGFYNFDASGNTTGITGASGTYVNKYSYLPFGETTTVLATLPNPFTYVGQFGVMSIGSGLVYMRSRWYNPATAAFTAPDPTGIAGGVNIYEYVYNNPIQYVDPMGTGSLNVPKVPGWADASDWETFWHSFHSNNRTLFNSLKEGFGRNGNINLKNKETNDAIKGLYKQWKKDRDKRNPPGGPPGGPPAVQEIPEYDNHGNPLPVIVGGAALLFLGVALLPGEITLGIAAGLAFIPKVAFAQGTNDQSADPNFLDGPAGYGTQSFIQAMEALPYTIDFENDGGVAAQNVTVTEQLDPNLDWSTFQLGSFGFGPIVVDIPNDLTDYQTTVSYQNTDGSSLSVQVSLEFNVATGLLTVAFVSLDPLSGQAPTGVFDGFLYPESESAVNSDGFVQYTVQPHAGLATGATINQQASIVFDTNPALGTNTATNTIDSSAPTSSVSALPAHSTSSFNVNWTGQDAGGPGVASYNVYVSDNGGTFTLWQSGTSETTATYSGQIGHTYAFYSVATDNIGNIQPTPAAAQATTIVVGLPTSTINSLPSVTTGPSFTLSWSGSPGEGASSVASYTIYDSEDGGPFVAFLADTNETTATFTGQAGQTYGFYSVATNNLGVVQPIPAGAQATTTVTSSPTPTPTPMPIPTQSLIIGEQPVFQRKLNKKGKPTGKPVLSGFSFNFGAALDSTDAANAANYQIDTVTTKKVKKKTVQTLHPITKFTVSYVAATDAVEIAFGTSETFPTGGQLTVLSGLTTASGGTLSGNAVFAISKGGKSVVIS